MRTIIYGPPGTGKTTKLISIMEDYLKEGNPRNICFTSFTKKSVEEAINRAKTKFNLAGTDLPFFKTIHSLAMNLGGIKNNDILQIEHKKELANILGVELTLRVSSDGTSFGMKDGDKLFHLMDYHRSKKISLQEAWTELGEELSWEEVDRFDKAYKAYKSDKLLVDFTDLLIHYLESSYVPRFDMLIVDEAQDLSPLQWDIIFKLEKNSKSSYIAGDDDQGIYGWNGSLVDIFINLEGEKMVLDRSHRLNLDVGNLAFNLVNRIDKRVDKQFSTRPVNGHVEDIHFLDSLPLFKGEWLLLARNGYLLKEYEDHCIEQGFLYETSGYGPTKWPEVKAIISWERYRKGGGMTDTEKSNILSFVSDPASLDTKRPWYDLFDNIGRYRIEYLRACKRNNEKFLSKPRIHINTIHGVKGGEAENVCIMLDMSHNSFKNLENNYDEEARVFYVGITRAINNLYIKQPRTNKFFDSLVLG